MTAACEKSIVAYGKGAAPRNIGKVATRAYPSPTSLVRNRNIATPPKAVISATEPAVVTQLEISHPRCESSGICRILNRPTDAEKAGSDRHTIPGALSL